MPDFINVDNNGKYIKASAFNPYAKQIRESICPNIMGVEEFSFYTFRKTHISEMATKLTELVLIQHTGHSKVDTIRKYYSAKTETATQLINKAAHQVSDQFKWSMAVNSALPRDFSTSKYKPSKENPLYVKPKIEIPNTRIPKKFVPLDAYKEMFFSKHHPSNWLLPAEFRILIDCATLSPITCDDKAIYGGVTEDNFVITVKNLSFDSDELEQSIIEAFAAEHIILE